jgi:hypothetical protein
MKYLWVIYDERARTMGTDEAAVMDTAESLKEAKQSVRQNFPDSVIARYECHGDQLLNEVIEN